MAHELRIDGLVYQVSDPNAQVAYDRAIKSREDGLSAANARVENADKLVAQAAKDRDTAQAGADAGAARLKTLIKRDGQEIALGDCADAEKFDAFVNAIVERRAAARASLLVEARKHLGANEKFDAHVGKDGQVVLAKSDIAIKRLVVEKLDKDAKLDGKSADYVEARYDKAIEDAARGQRAPIHAIRENVVASAPERADAGPPPSDPKSAREAYIARQVGANTAARAGR